ncbi:MAG: hypothetical protein IKT41_00195 [Clostridia bacterium]|nr:hypothetical protein [Clostridia bacterium]
MIDNEKILNLYFIEQYKQIDISKLLNVSKSTVNRIIMADERYLTEKFRRQNANRTENKIKTVKYITNKRKSQKDDDTYQSMKKQHLEAARELSGGKKPISNRTYRDWNPSIYRYNEKTKCYVLKSGIKVGADVPKKISWKNY